MPNTLPLTLSSWSMQRGTGARSLAWRLRQAVESGALPPGARLPPTRNLAAQLGVGRNTVVAAYAVLQSQGWIEGRGRQGSFVTALAAPVRASARAASASDRASTPSPAGPTRIVRRLRTTSRNEVPPHLDWRLGQASTLSLPIATWRKACREVGRHLPPASDGDPRGEPFLRRAIAQWLLYRCGMQASADQIIVTQGASQAIAQLAELLLRPGDICAVESPGYVRAANIFVQQGAEVVPVPVDQEGMDIDRAFAGRAPALLHLTPAHHYPLGMRLSGPRRHRLLQLARRHGTLILENEYDHEFVREGPVYAPLMATAGQQTVLISTFAKALSPSLRLGFVLSSPDIADRLAQQIETQHQQVSWPAQVAVAWLLESGELERHLRRVRRRLEHLRSVLQQRLFKLDSGVRALSTQGGQHVLLSMQTPRASKALHVALIEAGVCAERVEQFALTSTPIHGVFMSFGQMTSAQLGQAIDTLATAVLRLR